MHDLELIVLCGAGRFNENRGSVCFRLQMGVDFVCESLIKRNCTREVYPPEVLSRSND